MADKKTPESKQTEAQDPFGWTKLFEQKPEQLEAAEKWWQNVHEQSYTRARQNVEASSSLMLETLRYWNDLATEWRKQCFAAAPRRAG